MHPCMRMTLPLEQYNRVNIGDIFDYGMCNFYVTDPTNTIKEKEILDLNLLQSFVGY